MAIVRSGHANALTDVSPPPPLRPRRAAVLACLREASEPVPAAEVAARTGLHVNTARFHLDGLVAGGLALRQTEPAETPGRPRVLYRPSRKDGPRSYRLMADMLIDIVATLDPEGSAADATGRVWGRRLAVEEEANRGRPALGRLDAVLERVGFAQSRGEGPEGSEMQISHCPFLELARERPDVVCTLHLGLLRGAAEQLEAPVEVTGLQPFARPGLCIATLGERR